MTSSREARKARTAELLALRERVQGRLMAIPGVRAVGVGLKEVEGAATDEIVLRVYVENKRPAGEVPSGQLVPAEIDGIRTDVLTWQPIQRTEDTSRYRPVRGGIQIGNGNGSTGTLGCLARRDSDQAWVALSNFHVMYSGESAGATDVRIGQPDVTCCCCCKGGFVGTVVDGKVGGEVDCAIATIDAGITHIHEIEEIGGVKGTNAAVPGDVVKKRGARTGLTRGIITEVTFSGTSGGVPMSNQLLITPDAEFPFFAFEGDSGSVVLSEDDEVMGLVFGRLKNGQGVANRILGVIVEMKITIPTAAAVSQTRRFRPAVAQAAGGRTLDWESVLWEELEADHPLAALLRRHRAEVWNLVQQNREVGLRWQRGQGPAFTAAFHRTTRSIGYRVPDEIEGVSLSQLLLTMAAVLEKAGSPALREDLCEEAIAWIPRLQHCRTADALWQEYQVLKHAYGPRRPRVRSG